MDLVASELRRLRRQVVDLNRRLALARVPGTIEEIDNAKRMVRVKIGEDAEGQPILSPWVR
ncbi:Miff domain-containing protein, partial [Hyphomicrobiaceae bacterium 22]|nr:Miff domain-containing protein [Prosthecodimorpha staleyi]